MTYQSKKILLVYPEREQEGREMRTLVSLITALGQANHSVVAICKSESEAIAYITDPANKDSVDTLIINGLLRSTSESTENSSYELGLKVAETFSNHIDGVVINISGWRLGFWPDKDYRPDEDQIFTSTSSVYDMTGRTKLRGVDLDVKLLDLTDSEEIARAIENLTFQVGEIRSGHYARVALERLHNESSEGRNAIKDDLPPGDTPPLGLFR